jgi:hypothetical protein
MDAREHWRAVYAAKRPDELSWHEPLPEPSLQALDRLGIGPESSLIDVGGGASALAAELAARGWRDLTVLDIAASAPTDAGDAGAAIRWIEADILRWQPDRAYDVWHDRALFHFLDQPAERRLYVDALEAGTQAGSVAIIAAFALDGPEACSGLPVHRYDAEGMAAEIGEAFAPIEAWTQAHVTPWGAAQSFQWGSFSRR